MATLGRSRANWVLRTLGFSLVGFGCGTDGVPEDVGGGAAPLTGGGGAPTTSGGTPVAMGGTLTGSGGEGGGVGVVAGSVGDGQSNNQAGVSTAAGATGTGGEMGGTETAGGQGPDAPEPMGGMPPLSAGGSSGPEAGSPLDAGTDTGGMMGQGTGSTDQYNADFEEFVGEDCSPSEAETINSHQLPDLFAFNDGTRMSKKSEWGCRRAEIKRAVEKYIHGEKPGKPEVVTGTVSANEISVHVEQGGTSGDFTVSVSLPSDATGPVPIIIGLGRVSDSAPMEGNMPVSMAATIREEGVAIGSYGHNEIASESAANGLFIDLYGNTGASAQVGWAWGISRVLDVLVDEKAAGRNDIIDPTAVGITGCSRNGKGAFTIGAFDERVALGLPQESGTGGVSALRIVNENLGGPNGQSSESIQSSFSAGPRWFGDEFKSTFSSAVDTLPVDMHSLVAMYAPRGLLVLDNSRIGELGSVAQHAASMAGAQVFKALGAEASLGYHGGNSSDPHGHCSFYQSQVEPLQRAIRGHLTRTAEPDGKMEPQPVATADLTEWVDWETPTLTDD